VSRLGSILVCASVLATGVLHLVGGAQAATPGISIHVEGGFGASRVSDLPVPSTSALTASAGFGFPVKPVRLAIELAATASEEFMARYIPEEPMPGQRTLTTLLVGMEAVGSPNARGPFVTGGIGVGHVTSSGARRGLEFFPDPGWSVPARSLTDLALGAGLGWRSTGGPGPLGFQLALRFHGVVHGGGLAASATALTLGLAY